MSIESELVKVRQKLTEAHAEVQRVRGFADTFFGKVKVYFKRLFLAFANKSL